MSFPIERDFTAGDFGSANTNKFYFGSYVVQGGPNPTQGNWGFPTGDTFEPDQHIKETKSPWELRIPPEEIDIIAEEIQAGQSKWQINMVPVLGQSDFYPDVGFTIEPFVAGDAPFFYFKPAFTFYPDPIGDLL